MNSGFEHSAPQRDLELLAISAIAAAEKAGVMDEVSRRLFERSPADLVEACESEGNVQLCYRPMVELVLRELNTIGSTADVDTAEQQRRIRWTLDIAGF